MKGLKGLRVKGLKQFRLKGLKGFRLQGFDEALEGTQNEKPPKAS